MCRATDPGGSRLTCHQLWFLSGTIAPRAERVRSWRSRHVPSVPGSDELLTRFVREGPIRDWRLLHYRYERSSTN